MYIGCLNLAETYGSFPIIVLRLTGLFISGSRLAALRHYPILVSSESTETPCLQETNKQQKPYPEREIPESHRGLLAMPRKVTHMGALGIETGDFPSAPRLATC